MVKITGVERHLRRIKAINSAATQTKLTQAVYIGAETIVVEARRLIADGAIQGKGHKPSSPGEPPNWDTGQLANETVPRQNKPLKAQAVSQSDHAAPLEFGSSKMAERPFMKPAAQNKGGETAKLVRKVILNAIAKES